MLEGLSSSRNQQGWYIYIFNIYDIFIINFLENILYLKFPSPIIN